MKKLIDMSPEAIQVAIDIYRAISISTRNDKYATAQENNFVANATPIIDECLDTARHAPAVAPDVYLMNELRDALAFKATTINNRSEGVEDISAIERRIAELDVAIANHIPAAAPDVDAVRELRKLITLFRHNAINCRRASSVFAGMAYDECSDYLEDALARLAPSAEQKGK